MSTYRAIVAGLTGLAGMAGHETGDYSVQIDCDAQRKQKRTPEGRLSLARHGVTYGLAQLATKLATYRATGIRVPMTAVLAGQAVEVVLHIVIDDGRLLSWFADRTGKKAFHELNAGGINGRALMDQAWHKGLQIPAGALITAAVAARKAR